MKTYLRRFTLGVALVFLSAGSVNAGGTKAEVLSDRQLGSIEGGYCFFWKCEGEPGTGECQPIADDTTDLCKTVTCKLEVDMEGNTEVLQCQISGETLTCSQSSTYIQCVRASNPAICIRDFNAQGCGDLVQTYCFPDIKHRKCVCDSGTDGTPCDWTSCLN